MADQKTDKSALFLVKEVISVWDEKTNTKPPFIILRENITRGSNLDLTPAAKVETVEEEAEKQADTPSCLFIPGSSFSVATPDPQTPPPTPKPLP